MRNKQKAIALGALAATGGIFGGLAGAGALNTPTPGLNIPSYATALVGITAIALAVLAIAVYNRKQELQQESNEFSRTDIPDVTFWAAFKSLCNGFSQNNPEIQSEDSTAQNESETQYELLGDDPDSIPLSVSTNSMGIAFEDEDDLLRSPSTQT